MKKALLMTARWTHVATARFKRKDWPEVIIWKSRAFVKATVGHDNEKYVERTLVHDPDIIERNRQKGS
jgi:hypothetical protein